MRSHGGPRALPGAHHGLLTAGFLLAAIALGPRGLTGQEGCQFGDEGNDVADRRTLSGGATITYVSNPHFVCADGVRIWADSAVAYSAQGLSHLMGAVRYVDRTRELRSDEARYFSQQERVQAQGNVYVRDTGDGSVIEHGELVYLRQTDFRDQESMTFTTGSDGVRPVATIQSRTADSAGAAAPEEGPRSPYVVVADWIFLQSGERFEAAGDVEIERDSLLAYADSAEYDRVSDRVLLRGSARVDGPTYDLRGRTIDLLTPDGATSEVHAARDAVLTGSDLVITSSQIRLYLTEGALDRLVATPLPGDTAGADSPQRTASGEVPAPGGKVPAPRGETPATGGELPAEGADAARAPTQPVALVDEFQLTADSIDILAPGERIERVFAAGRARSVSHARDSLNVPDLPPIASADWLEGDTVIVYFEPESPGSAKAPKGAEGTASPAEADSAGARYRVDRIRAMIGARSLYRLTPADSAARAGVDPPAIHYVVGDSITIVMNGDEVETMEVVGQTQGIHLEPLSARTVADSLADTTAVTDTLTGGGQARPDALPATPPEASAGALIRDLERSVPTRPPRPPPPTRPRAGTVAPPGKAPARTIEPRRQSAARRTVEPRRQSAAPPDPWRRP